MPPQMHVSPRPVDTSGLRTIPLPMSSMDRTPLYLEIAESVRQEILYGTLAPGDQLPTLRAMAEHWRCTLGTVQRAYAELAREGLLFTRRGQGTRVAQPVAAAAGNPALRRGRLENQAERFLLDMLAAIARKDYEDRRRRQAQGIEKAKAKGAFKGKQIDKQLHQRILSCLDSGMSIRAAATATGASTATVQRAKSRATVQP